MHDGTPRVVRDVSLAVSHHDWPHQYSDGGALKYDKRRATYQTAETLLRAVPRIDRVVLEARTRHASPWRAYHADHPVDPRCGSLRDECPKLARPLEAAALANGMERVDVEMPADTRLKS